MATKFTRKIQTALVVPTEQKPVVRFRTQRPLVRGAYAGAVHNRLNLDWNSAIESPDQEMLRDMLQLRGRSRDLVKNNVYASRYVSLIEINTIGPHGIALQSRVRAPNGELDNSINPKIEKAWDAWSEVADVSGKLSFEELEALAVRMVTMDGECFVRMIYGDDAGNDFGFALQLIDADFLDYSFNVRTTPGQNEIRQGVELDGYGRPIAYHFWTQNPYEGGRMGTASRIRVPAQDVVHLYRPLRSGMTRGAPWLHPAMANIKMLGEIMVAELVAVRTSASKMGFIKTAADNATPYLDNMDEGGFLPRESMEAQPGMIHRLDPGDEFQQWNPDHPSTAFDSFVKTVLRGIAASLNVSYAALTYDFSTSNYSSERVALLHERDFFRSVQHFFIRTLHRRVFKKWLGEALNSGALKLPSTNADAYSEVQFRPRGWQLVDVAKEWNANSTAIGLGVTSRTRIASEMGYDIKDVFREIANEEADAKALKIDISGAKITAKIQEPAPNDSGELDQSEENAPEKKENGKTEN